MKKYFTSLLLIVSSSCVVAQSFTFQNDVGSDVTGTTIIVSGVSTASDIQLDLATTNNDTAAHNVKVKRYETVCLPNATNFFCWAQCYGAVPACAPQFHVFPLAPNSAFYDYLPMNAGQTFPADGITFAAHFQPVGNVGVSTFRYVIFDGDNPSDSAVVDITFDIALGINEAQTVGSISDAYPNPANSFTTIEYYLNSTNNNAILEVYNMIGAKIISANLPKNQNNITIDMADITVGIYFYSLVIDGNTIQSRKLVVAH